MDIVESIEEVLGTMRGIEAPGPFLTTGGGISECDGRALIVDDLTGAETFLMRFTMSSLRGFNEVGQLFPALANLVLSWLSRTLMLVMDSLEPLSNELPELFSIPEPCLGESGEYEGELAFGESTKPPAWGLGFELAASTTAGICANCNGLGVCVREVGGRSTLTIEAVEL